ncbi:MAG: nickel pincer cofactor biosynthesis protein LarB [Bacteroidales bacterium]|jgi:NCAIR mutase (PurE)-related protein|nr:nickel pincer cofactor biosynthesis protein LarB [Bacteroidales bacterium]MCB9027776.1 nickel pincer cofactor biosynthesis protein LarB [Bacteroidales bacterium]MDD3737590.1 nickel pincer cofactor biosynthesis protein LarB [Bacteroidales bacterium]NLD63644.1 nickel pincer cofactor biosynthesis protein LarB [Bacteroidales bacterium]HOO67534.1 nickel pincer cofactor biosynthesis protein LarB [Bacteroidales bacterium]
MNASELEKILNGIRNGSVSVDEAMEKLRDFPYTDLGFARIDHHRELRTGYPEIVYCAGKTPGQVLAIFNAMEKNGNNIIGTRAREEVFRFIVPSFPDAVYYETARIISIKKKEIPTPVTKIAVITAGTSDIPVAEEAAVTAELLGNDVVRIYDAGVAGIHRLVDKLPEIRACRISIVIAGMEGALASVVGGLVNMPVIAVPTSVGYGASFEGISALLAMMTSCAAGVTVVNIDNGFGAGFAASRINRL